MKRNHDRDVARCTAELETLLPELAHKHTPLVLVAALTEQVASSLLQTRQSRECTPEQVRNIIARVRQLAFAGRPPIARMAAIARRDRWPLGDVPRRD